MIDIYIYRGCETVRDFNFYKIIIHQNQTAVKILLQKVAKFKTQSTVQSQNKRRIFVSFMILMIFKTEEISPEKFYEEISYAWKGIFDSKLKLFKFYCFIM